MAADVSEVHKASNFKNVAYANKETSLKVASIALKVEPPHNITYKT
jgi:hypothetical protein